MQNQILPIGIILHVDEKGFLVSQSSPHKIVEPWTVVVEDVKRAYVKNLGEKLNSLYIRGSVSRGTAVEGVSDIDILAIVNGQARDVDWSWRTDVRAMLTDKYPFVAGFDMSHNDYDKLMSGERKTAAFMIKAMAACVYGEYLASQLPGVKPNNEIIMASHRIGVKVNPHFLDGDNVSISHKMRWTCKQIVRSGFELVMQREQCYTRDLWPCYELFVMHYPQMAEPMHEVLEGAVFPSDDWERYERVLGGIGEWLTGEVSERLSVS